MNYNNMILLGDNMKYHIKNRVLQEAMCFINTKKTIREVADIKNASKSTVHKDLKERLPLIDNTLSIKVNALLDNHLKTRHIKGGEKTRMKFKSIK